MDFQLYIADGHRSQDAVQLNPRFMNHGSGFVDIFGMPRSEEEQEPYPPPYGRWSLQGRIEGAGRGQIHFWTNPSAAPFLYDVEAYLSTLYPAPTLYVGPNCQNLPAGTDIDQAWWEGPNVILECEIIGGLGDV